MSTTQTLVTGGETKLDYVPPHPQKGTKYHRYTIILYEQPNQGQDKVDIHVDKREGFDVKKLAETHSLQVRGVSFFREVWDETVSMIYKDILSKLLFFNKLVERTRVIHTRYSTLQKRMNLFMENPVNDTATILTLQENNNNNKFLY